MSKGVICESCHMHKIHTKTAMVGGKYYKNICLNCLGAGEDGVSGGAAGFDRRRQYEDNAQDTIQPYDANGKPRLEFYRLYPEAGLKVFGAKVVEELKRKI